MRRGTMRLARKKGVNVLRASLLMTPLFRVVSLSSTTEESKILISL
jgi:hypothetical protein